MVIEQVREISKKSSKEENQMKLTNEQRDTMVKQVDNRKAKKIKKQNKKADYLSSDKH